LRAHGARRVETRDLSYIPAGGSRQGPRTPHESGAFRQDRPDHVASGMGRGCILPVGNAASAVAMSRRSRPYSANRDQSVKTEASSLSSAPLVGSYSPSVIESVQFARLSADQLQRLSQVS